MTGGVKKVSDLTASIATYEGWTLRPGTRDALRKAFPDTHLLVFEYIVSLHRMYQSLLALQEKPEASGRMEDYLRGEVKNVLTKSPFSLVRWQQIYLNEIDDTAEVAKLLNDIDVTVGECAALAPSADMTSEQVAEMKAMFEEELAESLEKLEKNYLQDLHAIIHRRVAASDVLGSVSRTWILEVSGKAGGEEASIFAGELLDYFKNYGKNMHGWSVEPVEEETAAGASVPNLSKLRFVGDGVYRHFRHEIGVHKVQRVPVTDADGKMQTSTAVVTMMPVLDPIAVDVREEDCRFDFVRGSGPGGQGMQSSSNCCVLLHKPSGINVKCHQSRSALGNKEIAMQMVAQQILVARVKEAQSEQDAAWANQWFSGERSEKMRTYNFPQNRVTDHRLGRDFPLATFLDGSGKLLLELHDSMNVVDDLLSTDAALRRHLRGKFGSDTV
jgi:peptide chain release factor 1